MPDGRVVTVDALVEGVHWDERLSPADVGWKAVAASVSDCCAMGATPEWMVLALALPADFRDDWVDAFAAGFGAAAREWDIALVGGDTTRSPGPVFVSITMAGRLAAAPVLRSGARPGDDVWVTGWPGLAGLGYLVADPPAEALAALRRPRPNVAFATALARDALPTAMLDLSDGIASDLPRLCAASGVGAAIDPAAIPHHPVLGADPLAYQVAAGDDYELLFTAPSDRRAAIARVAEATGARVARIGAIAAGADVTLTGRAWPAPFVHFRDPRGSR